MDIEIGKNEEYCLALVPNMQHSSFDSLSRQVSIAAISGYQKHISPYKGFVCAHRLLYGGESCSGYFKRVVAKEGLKAAFVNSRERFQACKQANQILRAQTENSEESTEEEADTQQRQKTSGKVAQKSSFISTNNTDCFDCADLGCNCAEMVSITPDCGFPDCSGADCSFLDCGSCGS